LPLLWAVPHDRPGFHTLAAPVNLLLNQVDDRCREKLQNPHRLSECKDAKQKSSAQEGEFPFDAPNNAKLLSQFIAQEAHHRP
jgi:hypothetical protein